MIKGVLHDDGVVSLDLKGTNFDIAMEYVVLTKKLYREYPKVMEIADQLFDNIEYEVKDD